MSKTIGNRRVFYSMEGGLVDESEGKEAGKMGLSDGEWPGNTSRECLKVFEINDVIKVTCQEICCGSLSRVE